MKQLWAWLMATFGVGAPATDVEYGEFWEGVGLERRPWQPVDVAAERQARAVTSIAWNAARRLM